MLLLPSHGLVVRKEMHSHSVFTIPNLQTHTTLQPASMKSWLPILPSLKQQVLQLAYPNN
jgi:hypothetical protein